MRSSRIVMPVIVAAAGDDRQGNPDRSRIADHRIDRMVRVGTIACRPIDYDTARMLLMFQRRRAESVPRAVRDCTRPSYAGHGN
ncbi:hypothetical protein [Streptomyces sp. NPDC007205]|uniref:hypothetical protein n=1 Tax=Streptomyces sp. NPDC007205 TaxID=3154316 RepID=UPI0033F29228